MIFRFKFWFWRKWGNKRYQERALYVKKLLHAEPHSQKEVIAENIAAGLTGRVRRNRRKRL